MLKDIYAVVVSYKTKEGETEEYIDCCFMDKDKAYQHAVALDEFYSQLDFENSKYKEYYPCSIKKLTLKYELD